MANYSSVKSGLWSDPATWGGSSYPSQNGDTATINPAHTVIYDIDTSNLTTGLGQITVNGTLKIASHSRLKIAAHITGSGILRCGEQTAEVEDVQILINGNYSIQISDAQFWGKDRTGPLTGYLTQNYNIGATQLQVDRDMDIRVNDTISISASTISGQTSDNNPLGRGMYQVLAYNPQTRTITITPSLNGNNRLAGDIVAILSREIYLNQLSKSSSNPRVNADKSNQIYRNVYFNNFGNGVLGGSNHQIHSCSGSNTTNGGICYYGSNHTLSGTFTTTNTTYGGICYWGSNHLLSGTFTTTNTTYGGICHYGSNHLLSGTFTTTNNTNGGICYWGSNHLLSGTFTTTNNTNGGICHYGSNHLLSGTFTTTNNTNGGICHWGSNHLLSGTFTTTNNTNGGICYWGSNHTLSGTFTTTESIQINCGIYYISGTFNKKNIYYRTQEFLFPYLQTIWLNYDGEGLHRIFAYAGQVQTIPEGIKFLLEDPTTYLILDIPFRALSKTLRFTQKVKKNTSMSYLPNIQLIDPLNDPLKTTTGTPILQESMTDSINQYETLSLVYDNLVKGKNYIIRLIAKSNTGEIIWQDRSILDIHGIYGKNVDPEPPAKPEGISIDLPPSKPTGLKIMEV